MKIKVSILPATIELNNINGVDDINRQLDKKKIFEEMFVVRVTNKEGKCVDTQPYEYNRIPYRVVTKEMFNILLGKTKQPIEKWRPSYRSDYFKMLCLLIVIRGKTNEELYNKGENDSLWDALFLTRTYNTDSLNKLLNTGYIKGPKDTNGTFWTWGKHHDALPNKIGVFDSVCPCPYTPTQKGLDWVKQTCTKECRCVRTDNEIIKQAFHIVLREEE